MVIAGLLEPVARIMYILLRPVGIKAKERSKKPELTGTANVSETLVWDLRVY